MLFDSHSHLHFYQFDNPPASEFARRRSRAGDRGEIIKKLRDFDVKTINIGTDFEESKKAVELAKKYPDILWASVGLHPNNVFKENFDVFKYGELVKDDRVVAIGECGLDYYRIETRDKEQETKIKNKQKEIFIKQIELAKELNKPLILHCRSSVGTQDAYEDAISVIENCKLPARRSFVAGGKIENCGNGVAHFFSGSKETAKKFMDLGFYISFAGPITFAPEYRDIVEFVPIEHILIETDSPFAAPMPHRGKRNEPAFVEFIARKIGEWKGLSFDKVAAHTTLNALRLFKIT